ncbi:MAG: nitroreductase [Pseudomonadota bacterium]
MRDDAAAPEFGQEMAAAHPSAEAIDMLRLRRSTTADCLGEPGPDDATLQKMLAIAARAPDHRRLTPFRFVLFRGDARAQFGDVLARAYRDNEPAAETERVALEGRRFLRAPVVVAVISSVNPESRTPEWEQILTVGAVCQNLLLASSAYGFAAQWLTEWYAFDENVGDALGLGENERVAGYIYIGTARDLPRERARPVLTELISEYSPD